MNILIEKATRLKVGNSHKTVSPGVYGLAAKQAKDLIESGFAKEATEGDIQIHGPIVKLVDTSRSSSKATPAKTTPAKNTESGKKEPGQVTENGGEDGSGSGASDNSGEGENNNQDNQE